MTSSLLALKQQEQKQNCGTFMQICMHATDDNTRDARQKLDNVEGGRFGFRSSELSVFDIFQRF